MEERNLSKSLDIVARLINGDEISRDDKNGRELYEEYTTNSQIYDITNSICKPSGSFHAFSAESILRN